MNALAPDARTRVSGGPDDVGDLLFDRVRDTLTRYVAYPDLLASVANTLWIAHAHLIGCFENTPRLAFLSPEPGSGKSRALEVTAALAPNPVETMNVTPAYVLRRVSEGDTLPTLLIDEIDTIFGSKAPGNEDLRGFINAGHRKGAFAGRCVAVSGKRPETEDLPAFCAVALAGLGDLPETIMQRSVVIRMRKRAPHERVEPYRRIDTAAAMEGLKADLEGWKLLVEDKARRYRPALPACVVDRPADVWEPLIVCGDLAGQRWGRLAREAAEAFINRGSAAGASLGVLMLQHVRLAFGDRNEMHTAELLPALIAMDEAPWGDMRGKPLDARRMGKLLAAYGIASSNIRTGAAQAKGYRRADFMDAWSRYLPEAQP